MKTIVLYILVAAGGVGSIIGGIATTKRGATITYQQKVIVEQRELIERLARQEAIAIHITNEFRSNAVLGKVVVDANVKNVAEQTASILKAELLKK